MSTTPFASASAAGLELGKTARLTEEKTRPLAKIFQKANAEKREQMRNEFMLAYMMGKLELDAAAAKVVLDTSRGKRDPIHHQAYKCGTDQFANHIIRNTLRDEKEAAKGGAGNKTNKSTDKVAACVKYINNQGLTKVQLKKLIAQLTA